MKYPKINAVIAASFISAFSFSAHANLLVNGSFEDNEVAPGTWQYYSPEDVNGWDGSNIELWNDLNGVQAYDGVNFAELNAHPDTAAPFYLFQTFTTEVNQTYNVSFAYHARTNNSESFEFFVGSSGDSLIGNQTYTLSDHTTDGWSVFQDTFTAYSTESMVMFTPNNPGTLGNLLDDVVVTAIPVEVPEPATLGLLGLGVVGLIAARRRQKAS